MNSKNELYISYKHTIAGKWKSKRYIKWFKDQYPIFDAHHLLGKSYDYLLMFYQNEFHIRVVHKNRQGFFAQDLRTSIAILNRYAVNQLGADYEKLTSFNLTPEGVKELFIYIRGLENGHE